jgi:hypothetical protein
MATALDYSSTPTPTLLKVSHHSPQQQQPLHHQQSASDQQQPPSPTQSTNPAQAIHAPLPTRRMLSQLLRQWQQSLSPQTQPISPVKDQSLYTSNQTPLAHETYPKTDMTTIPQTPQTSRTPSRLLVSSQYLTPTSTSPNLALTTSTHTRRASITTFLSSESLLMSPIPRARNPGGFRPTSSGSMSLGVDELEGMSPFDEVIGLVGGWEDKMNPTTWTVVNTTTPSTSIPMETEEMVLKEERRSKSVDVSC